MQMKHVTTRQGYPFGVQEESEEDLFNMILFKEAFSDLPPKQQAVLGLRLQGYTQGAISKILNISRTTVGSIEQKAIAETSKRVQV
jgi:RNA polymerase sigma factor (sigma-70 family)